MKQFKEAKEQHKKEEKYLDKKVMDLFKVVNKLKELDDEELEVLAKLVYGKEVEQWANNKSFIEGFEAGLKLKQKKE